MPVWEQSGTLAETHLPKLATVPELFKLLLCDLLQGQGEQGQECVGPTKVQLGAALGLEAVLEARPRLLVPLALPAAPPSGCPAWAVMPRAPEPCFGRKHMQLARLAACTPTCISSAKCPPKLLAWRRPEGAGAACC